MIVGLTGGIASGKSTVSNMLRALGAYVVDADIWARRVVEPGTPGLAEIVDAFGSGVLNPDGSLSRRALATIVFQDEQARLRLNGITHPKVRSGMKGETEAYLQQHPSEPVVWDVPLLFEGETRKLVDCTVLIYVDEQTQMIRLIHRDGWSEEEATLRVRAQMPMEQKRVMADYVIDNRGTLDETREQVNRIWQILRSRAENDHRPSY